MSQGAPAIQTIGRYRLLGELGRGAMGVVYRAEDPNIGRTVALKTQRLDVQGTEQQDLLRRLRQEARSAGVLNHPNIVTIYDAGEQDALFYIAMEYIEGATLQSMLTPGKAMPVDQIVEVVRQICAGLDYAHARQIVHRDIKPANIMITPEGAAKIMDFGIAKTGSGMTSAGQVLGTPSYMSPEQVKGKALDGRSDLFSVGVILYEAITGQKPFTGDNITTIIYKIVNEEPVPPRELDLSVHPGLNQVITRALCKSLDQRYQRGWDLARDLMNYKALATSMGQPATESDQTVALSTAQLRVQAAALRDAQAAAQAAPVTSGAVAAAPAAAEEAAVEVAGAATPGTAQRPAAVQQAATPPKMSRSTQALLATVVLLLAILGLGSRAVWRARHAQTEAAAAAQPAESAPAQPKPTDTSATTSSAPSSETTSTPTAETKPPATSETAVPLTKAEKHAKTAKKEAVTAQPQPTVPPEAIAVSGQIRILSTPSGANVSIDGKPQGSTPLTVPEVSPGAHTVTLSKAGFRPETRNVEVERGKRAQINAVLVSSMASVNANSTPVGASIVIDGTDTGKLTPAQVQVAEGSHKVSLRLQGWRAFDTTVTLKPGETYNLAPELAKDSGRPFGFLHKVFGSGDPANKGTLIIRTRPPGATVLVNGNQLPRATPIPRAPMEAGKYHVTIKLQGYKTVERDVTIEKGKVVDLSGPLEKQ